MVREGETAQGTTVDLEGRALLSWECPKEWGWNRASGPGAAETRCHREGKPVSFNFRGTGQLFSTPGTDRAQASTFYEVVSPNPPLCHVLR